MLAASERARSDISITNISPSRVRPQQADGEDELKKRQLMELAIINGTYRDSTIKTAAAGKHRLLINMRIGIASASMCAHGNRTRRPRAAHNRRRPAALCWHALNVSAMCARWVCVCVCVFVSQYARSPDVSEPGLFPSAPPPPAPAYSVQFRACNLSRTRRDIYNFFASRTFRCRVSALNQRRRSAAMMMFLGERLRLRF